MLQERAYIGILDYNRYQGRGAREPVEIPGFYPAIIDQELYRRVQETLKNEKNSFQNAFAHWRGPSLPITSFRAAHGHG